MVLIMPTVSTSPGAPTRLTFDAAQACRQLTAIDPVLGGVIQRVGAYAPHNDGAEDAFHRLLRAVIYQQLSGHAAAAIHARVLAALNAGDAPGPAAIDAASESLLREAGLSASKARCVKALARASLDGRLPAEDTLPTLDDATLIDRYSQIRGIGRWTVEMLLIFHLGRPDVMPSGDLGVRKGYALTYQLDDLPKPKQLEQLCECWRPYRSVGSWYMWRALELTE